MQRIESIMEVTHNRGCTFCFNLFFPKYIFLYKRTQLSTGCCGVQEKSSTAGQAIPTYCVRLNLCFRDCIMVTVSYHHMFDAKNAILIYFRDLAILRDCVLKCSISLSRFAFHFLSYLTVYPGGPMSSF